MGSNSEYERLMAAMQRLMSDRANAEMPMPTGVGGGRPLNDADRRARGIDPRDPNQYQVMPDGNTMGTYMAWKGMPDQMENGYLQRPNIPQPSANHGGKYRLSPGVYGTREQAMQKFQGGNNNWFSAAMNGLMGDGYARIPKAKVKRGR